MSPAELVAQATDGLQPHVVAVALISARLLPIAFLCPLFGGSHAPMTVKLGLTLALASSLHVAGGVQAPATHDAFELVGLAGAELVLGLTLGLVASLPFDAARMGGRFVDLFRGSSAEAALPLAGTKEAATGDVLFHLLLAAAATGPVLPLTLGAVWKSFALVKLGGLAHTEALGLTVAGLVGVAFSTGLAIGAPIAGVSLAIDATVGLASRAAPNLNLKELGAPIRILAGGALAWLALGVIASRLLDVAARAPDTLTGLLTH